MASCIIHSFPFARTTVLLLFAFFFLSIYFHLMNSFRVIAIWFRRYHTRSHWMNWLDATQWIVCTVKIQVNENSVARKAKHKLCGYDIVVEEKKNCMSFCHWLRNANIFTLIKDEKMKKKQCVQSKKQLAASFCVCAAHFHGINTLMEHGFYTLWKRPISTSLCDPLFCFSFTSTHLFLALDSWCSTEHYLQLNVPFVLFTLAPSDNKYSMMVSCAFFFVQLCPLCRSMLISPSQSPIFFSLDGTIGNRSIKIWNRKCWKKKKKLIL